MKNAAREKKPDLILLLVTLLLVTVGTVMIYSSSSILAMDRFRDGQLFLKKQLLFLVLGLLVMVLMTRIPYYKLRKLAWAGIGAAALLLVLIWIPPLGIKAGGASRWLNLGIFSFQVSELAKVALILFLAHYLTQKVNHVKELGAGVLTPLAITGVLVVLIVLQPDFGTTVIIAFITLMMIYLAGGRILHLAGIASLFLPVAGGTDQHDGSTTTRPADRR